MFWSSVCRGQKGYARLRFNDLASISAVPDRRCSAMRSHLPSVLFSVPQDSVLGPLLFLIKTADMGEIASRSGLSSQFPFYTSGLHRLSHSSEDEWSLALSRSRIDAV